MVSIRDVAKHANVSISAVSKALNGYPDVSEDTRKKVLQSVEKLNYSPNMLAKNLKQKMVKSIALIFSNFEATGSKDDVIYQIMQGSYAAASHHNYEIVIYTRSLSEQRDKSYWQFCREHKLSGAIITGLKTTDPYFLELIDSKFPCVVIDAKMSGSYTGSTMTNNIEAVEEAVQYLIDKGHRHIGMVNGHDYAVVSKERQEGYRRALEKNGIPYRDYYVINANYKEEYAYDKAGPYLAGAPEITAVFCSSDLMAIGFMNRCRELGISVPDQLSVIGFDDIILSSYTTPKLTTVKQDFKYMGSSAFEQMIRIIENKEEGFTEIVPYEFVERESVKAIQ